MPRKDILGWRIYDWCRPRSLADALQIIGAAVATAWFGFTQDFGQWRPILPLLAVAFFSFTLWAVSLIRQLLYADDGNPADGAVAQHSASPAGHDSDGQAVEFTVPGSWAELGFRCRNLGVDGRHELAAEEVYLRIKARRNMQNVWVEIAARHSRPDTLEPVAKIGSSKFSGAVTKGREQSFQIMQRTYWNVPATFADPSTGQQASRSIRVEKEVHFFPENPRRFLGQIGHLYYFRVTVHHDNDDGPDQAEFAINVQKRREGPQSVLRTLKNIQAVDK